MSSITTKTARKLLRFFVNPENSAIITDAKKSAYETIYDPKLWHHLFLHFFSSEPKDPVGKENARNMVPGSNDPRWDELLHTRKGLKALALLLRYLEWKEKLQHKTNSKAA